MVKTLNVTSIKNLPQCVMDILKKMDISGVLTELIVLSCPNIESKLILKTGRINVKKTVVKITSTYFKLDTGYKKPSVVIIYFLN